MTRYRNAGDLSIDNKATERSLRCIAVGRGNWMFLGSDQGGKTVAVFFCTFIASCKLVKVDSFAFRDMLSQIAGHPINNSTN